MASLLNRTTLEYLPSGNTPDYPAESWIHNPDLSLVQGIEKKYWVIEGDTVRAMTTAEKDAEIATWKYEHAMALMQSLIAYGNSKMPETVRIAMHDEYNSARIENRVSAAAYLKPWVDFDKLVTDEYKSRRDTILSATTHDAVFAVSLDFSNLDVSVPSPISVSDARQM